MAGDAGDLDELRPGLRIVRRRVQVNPTGTRRPRASDAVGAWMIGIGNRDARSGSRSSSVMPAVKSPMSRTLKSASRPNLELSATKKASLPALERHERTGVADPEAPPGQLRLEVGVHPARHRSRDQLPSEPETDRERGRPANPDELAARERFASAAEPTPCAEQTFAAPTLFRSRPPSCAWDSSGFGRRSRGTRIRTNASAFCAPPSASAVASRDIPRVPRPTRHRRSPEPPSPGA